MAAVRWRNKKRVLNQQFPNITSPPATFSREPGLFGDLAWEAHYQFHVPNNEHSPLVHPGTESNTPQGDLQ